MKKNICQDSNSGELITAEPNLSYLTTHTHPRKRRSDEDHYSKLGAESPPKPPLCWSHKTKSTSDETHNSTLEHSLPRSPEKRVKLDTSG
jgi:hypothetical protein